MRKNTFNIIIVLRYFISLQNIGDSDSNVILVVIV